MEEKVITASNETVAWFKQNLEKQVEAMKKEIEALKASMKESE